MSQIKKTKFRIWLQVFLTGLIAWLVLSFIGSCFSTRIQFKPIPSAATLFDYPVEEITINTTDGVSLAAWFIPVSQSTKSIILLNGIGANRLGLVERAKFYVEEGYNVLLLDLRGTGKSGGDLISFGWFERLDLLASYKYLQDRGFDFIAAHGLSLGAATIAYSLPENDHYQFIILESCYDEISNALFNRTQAYYIPNFICRPMQWFTEKRLGISTSKLAPENYVQFCSYPVFIMAGDSEFKVKKSETLDIYNNVLAQTKDLHFFKGGKHENFMNRFKEEYKAVLSKWLDRFE